MAHRVTFDFGDHPRLFEALKMFAARQGTTQKSMVVDALTAYISQKQGDLALLLAGDATFAEWITRKIGFTKRFDMVTATT